MLREGNGQGGGKTDPIDAKVLARLANTADELPLTPVSSQAQRDLLELQRAREALVEDRTVILNRSKHLRLGVLKRQSRNVLREIERQRDRIDAEIRRLLEDEDELARKA